MMTVSLYNCGHCKLPQLVGQRCHCRTPEDEAFDELAKRQGDWGGGFPAKRAMAADKMQEPAQEPVGDDWTLCMKLPVVVYVRKQRLGESHVSTREGITPVKPDDLIMRGVSGEEYPIGRAIFEQTYSLNTTPPQREWVGLTDDEIKEIIGLYGATPIKGYTRKLFDQIEAKLREKNT